MHNIRDGQQSDLEVLIATLTDSFTDDPFMNWVIPDPSLYAGFFRLVISEVFLPRGITHMEDGGKGAALWLPPLERFDIPLRWALIKMVCQLVSRKGFDPLRRMKEHGDLFDQYHPTKLHYYLQFVGARTQDQGQGVGSALLKQGTRLCDEKRMPAYLESSKEENVPLYQRHGFEVIAEDSMLRGGPKAWFMWREPRELEY
jgi:ribosomal protein S18 acetylase RimI-like enzyme